MYYASKHAVRVLTEGLRQELVVAKSRIRVSEVSPGLVHTSIFDPLDINQKLLWNSPHLNPEDIADSVLYAIASPAHVQKMELL
ncbi:Farnesol dehydrogenase [Gryllus bimaculatus]|nr:Farnesol dehydrogenase [Gryllus bimaculatus]